MTLRFYLKHYYKTMLDKMKLEKRHIQPVWTCLLIVLLQPVFNDLPPTVRCWIDRKTHGNP